MPLFNKNISGNNLTITREISDSANKEVFKANKKHI